MGNNEVAHASGKRYPTRGDIRVDSLENALKHSFKGPIFLRPADLVKADESAASSGGGSCPTTVQGPAVAAPSNAILRFMKGQEGYHRIGGYYNREK